MRRLRLALAAISRRVFALSEGRVFLASLILVGAGLWWIHPPLGLLGPGLMLWWSLQGEDGKA